MDRKISLILSLLITILIASNFYFFSLFSEKKLESVIVSRVIDGDTIVLQDGRTIRLLNINSPEKDTPSSKLSIEFLKGFENHTLQLKSQGLDKYSRVLGKLYTPEYLNLEIVRLGLASKFLVEPSELKDFSEAEKFAIENSLGIWTKSPYYGCFKSEIDETSEIVFLINSCDSVYLDSWTLKDESRKTYKFEKIQLGSINLNSKQGNDNSTDLFWNSNTNIWNNDRDSLYLFDEKGNIAHYSFYGY